MTAKPGPRCPACFGKGRVDITCELCEGSGTYDLTPDEGPSVSIAAVRDSLARHVPCFCSKDDEGHIITIDPYCRHEAVQKALAALEERSQP